MTESNEDTSRRVTRRDVVGLVSAAMIGSLAGCSGGGSGNTTPTNARITEKGRTNSSDTDTQQKEGEPVHDTMKLRFRRQPTDIQFNLFNPKNTMWMVNQMLWDRAFFTGRNVSKAVRSEYMPKVKDGNAGEYVRHIPIIYKDWAIPANPKKGSKITLQLRDDPPHRWHNGDPVTADDIWTRERINQFLTKGSDTMHETHISDHGPTGKYTYEYKLKKAINPTLIRSEILGRTGGLVHAKHSVFKDTLQQFEDATTENERNKVMNELFSRRIGPDEVIGNSMFKIDEVTSKKIVMKPFEDYENPATLEKFADDERVPYHNMSIPNISTLELVYFSNDQETPMVKSGAVHGARISQKVSPSTLPDDYRSVWAPSSDNGMGFGFNANKGLLKKREVRQALNYIIDRRAIVETMFPPSLQGTDIVDDFHVKHYAGMSDRMAKKWLTNEQLKQFRAYGDGIDRAKEKRKATELLKKAGLSKENGTWKKPDGSTWKPEVGAPPFWKKGAEPAANLLRKFGIKAQFTVYEESVWFGKKILNGDWTMGSVGWYNGDVWAIHPYKGLNLKLANQTMDNPQNVRENNIPENPKIPGTIGDYESPTETIDISKEVGKLQKPLSEEKMRHQVQLLAWVFNNLSHRIQLTNFTAREMHHKEFRWPRQGTPNDWVSPWYNNGIQLGAVRSKWKSEIQG